MLPAVDAVLRSWPYDPSLWITLAICAAIYLRGWHILSRRDPTRWHAAQPLSFLGGLLALFLALGSPLEPFTSLLLQAHMAQHLLLVMVAPPLLWLAAPFFPLLRGWPAQLRSLLAPLLRSTTLHRLFARLTHPIGAGLLFFLTTWSWHLPALYELALTSPRWHYFQHACFLVSGLLFWYPVVRPYPAKPTWSKWLLVPYLILTDVQNTALSALLSFSDEPWYPHYAAMPRLVGSVIDDQIAAGVLMWVPGSIAYLVPLFLIGLQLLFPQAAARPGQTKPRRIALPLVDSSEQGLVRQWKETARSPLPLIPEPSPARGVGRSHGSPLPKGRGVRGKGVRKPRWDLLRVPILGNFLRWQFARPLLQLTLLVLAVVVMLDGWLGPPITPLNLAGVLPWIHWRGLLVFSLFALGNVFCYGCPFLLPRTLARRWLPASRPWPRWLRNKWPAIVLFALFLWAYEAFALWDRPGATACLALAYFLTAFVIDGIFRHASFCKFVCPIGQFNFVTSLVSPTELAIRERSACDSCTTKDCIRGSSNSPGCELALYLPRKQGNMDCTLCLDCVHACPHDNIELRGRLPASELWSDPQRSGLGRFSQRPDLAVLVLLFVFGAFANAGGMIAPVVDWQDALTDKLGWSSPLPLVTAFYVVAVGLPTFLLLFTSRKYVFSLVPLGTAMWFSHYCFHFFTSYEVVIPALQRVAFDLGWYAQAPTWVCSCCALVPAWLIRAEILALEFGLLLSLYTAWRVADRSPIKTTPYAILIIALFILGVWILLQPMQMRGTMMG